MRSIASPGHTEGSISFVVDDTFLLSGDTLFTVSIGRPDLAGQAEQWVQDLHNTLYEKYPSLSLDLIVLPSHFSELSEIGTDGTVQARMETNDTEIIQDCSCKMLANLLPPFWKVYLPSSRIVTS